MTLQSEQRLKTCRFMHHTAYYLGSRFCIFHNPAPKNNTPKKKNGGQGRFTPKFSRGKLSIDFKQWIPTSLTHGDLEASESLPGGTSADTVGHAAGGTLAPLPRPCAADCHPQACKQVGQSPWDAGGGGRGGVLVLRRGKQHPVRECLRLSWGLLSPGRRTVGGLQTSQQSFLTLNTFIGTWPHSTKMQNLKTELLYLETETEK